MKRPEIVREHLARERRLLESLPGLLAEVAERKREGSPRLRRPKKPARKVTTGQRLNFRRPKEPAGSEVVDLAARIERRGWAD